MDILNVLLGINLSHICQYRLRLMDHSLLVLSGLDRQALQDFHFEQISNVSHFRTVHICCAVQVIIAL